MQYVFLSHDVDWKKQGPPLEHIMARKDRFSLDNLSPDQIQKLYYNFPDYMEIEEKFGIKSTFFFRTIYENGNYADYEDEVQQLSKGGWEIGLHLDPSSVDDINAIKREKNALEQITKKTLKGNRVHYLGFNDDLPNKLYQCGFVYDSTFRVSKDKIDKNELGFFQYGNLVEFPLTLMDAYLFTHMKIDENGVVPVVEKTLNLCRELNPEFNVMTINWHDNVLKMKGGRMYTKIIEYLASQDDVKIVRGIDLAEIVLNKKSS